jgi:kynurenine formamidase
MPQDNSVPQTLFSDFALGRMRIIDLSHALNDSSPQWPGDTQSFWTRTESSIEHDGYFARTFWAREHYGTHLDAPAHFSPGTATVDQIPAERLFGPAVGFDVRAAAAVDADFELSAADVERWEAAHGRIAAGSIVLLRTGWAARWHNAADYTNQDEAGIMHFPGFGKTAVETFIEREISGIGTDAMSVDPGRSVNFPVHHLALNAGLYHLENLAELGAIASTGALLVVAPLKLQGGSGAPCRVFAFVPAVA